MSDRVRFFLNGERHEVVQPRPTTTVLEYLRETRRLCGTKEGCAEGDCGACTAVVAERDGDSYRLRPVNTCIQFLPVLDGCELLTVDGLAAPGGLLHPAQRAMVECHGSQCGFCTPGFVMSLFMLYKTHAEPDEATIRQALSGNLCRCTGYRPILDAARRMYDFARDVHGNRAPWTFAVCDPGAPPLAGERALIERLRGIRRGAMLELDHEGRYYAPLQLAELANVLAAHPDATLLAGGTDVGLWVTKQHRDLPVVVYLGDVAELHEIEDGESCMRIGAAVNLHDAFAALLTRHGGLGEIARRFASPPVCHAGTLVGNVANGSPIGDSMPALMCLGARLVLRQGARERHVDLDEFYLGYRNNALQAGEFVAALEVPHAAADTVLRSYKISKRFEQDISAVCGAFRLRLHDGHVADIDICFGGMAATPLRARGAEAALRGRTWDAAALEDGVAALARDFTPLSDMRASEGYRQRIAGNLLRKFHLETTRPGERGRVFDLRSLAP